MPCGITVSTCDGFDGPADADTVQHSPRTATHTAPPLGRISRAEEQPGSPGASKPRSNEEARSNQVATISKDVGRATTARFLAFLVPRTARKPTEQGAAREQPRKPGSTGSSWEQEQAKDSQGRGREARKPPGRIQKQRVGPLMIRSSSFAPG